MVFPAYQEFALSFEVRVGKRDGAGDCSWSGLVWSFFPGILFRVLGNGLQRRLALSRRYSMVVEICFMGSVALGK